MLLFQVDEFFKEKVTGKNMNNKQALEEIRSNIRWLENHEKEVGDWLADWHKNNWAPHPDCIWSESPS